MTWKPVVVAVLSCALIAGCSGSSTSSGSSAASVDTLSPSSTAPISLDGGALVIDPLLEPGPPVGRAVAARELAAAQVGAGPQTVVAAHVRVDVPAPSAVSVAYGSLQRLDLPRAWVYVLHNVPASDLSCRMAPSGQHFGPSVSPSPVPTDASGDYAVIVDATTGRGYVYSGAGTGPCRPASAPSLSSLDLLLSVPYRVKQFTPRSAQIVLTVPPCGRQASFSPSFQSAAHQGTATAWVPTGACTGGSYVVVQNISGRYTSGSHAPIGLVCGEAYDADLGRPADCVA
jgi:hypothetical protein